MNAATDRLKLILDEANIVARDIQERFFPGEHWFIVYVPAQSLAAAQGFAGDIESALSQSQPEQAQVVLAFRPERLSEAEALGQDGRGQLHGARFDQFIQLLEARSRTSDALPSLKYVEDPRASLAAIAASRHQLIYGRRGVGKTALMLEAKRNAERDGHAAVWMNAHVLRGLSPEAAFRAIALAAVDAIARHLGTSASRVAADLQQQATVLRSMIDQDNRPHARAAVDTLPDLNTVFRSALRADIVRLYIFLDDFYLMSRSDQPQLLDLLAGMLRDCDGWLKIASIERLTRPWDPSNRAGLELPHDASKVDLDVTLEDPAAAQDFLESVLSNYTNAVGIGGPTSIAKSEALGRLVLASGGVPRDYLNLVASSIVVARTSRTLARVIGKEDVAQAAGRSAASKKRDLEQDVSSTSAASLLAARDRIASEVRRLGYTYFRVDVAQKTHPAYELLSRLVDLRFAHLVHAGLSDQHRAGMKYEAYVLDLSEYSDVRLKRGLNVLDLEAGRWTWRLTGQKRTMNRLTGTQFRDQLRQSPLFDLDSLNDLVPPVEN